MNDCSGKSNNNTIVAFFLLLPQSLPLYGLVCFLFPAVYEWVRDWANNWQWNWAALLKILMHIDIWAIWWALNSYGATAAAVAHTRKLNDEFEIRTAGTQTMCFRELWATQHKNTEHPNPSQMIGQRCCRWCSARNESLMKQIKIKAIAEVAIRRASRRCRLSMSYN